MTEDAREVVDDRFQHQHAPVLAVMQIEGGIEQAAPKMLVTSSQPVSSVFTCR